MEDVAQHRNLVHVDMNDVRNRAKYMPVGYTHAVKNASVGINDQGHLLIPEVDFNQLRKHWNKHASDSPKEKNLWRLTKGVYKRVKVKLKLDQVSPETQRIRRAICGECPYSIKYGEHLKCGICGCPARDKTSLKGEKCPDKPPRW